MCRPSTPASTARSSETGPTNKVYVTHKHTSCLATRLTCQFDGLSEERGPVEIAVVGTIPAWAAGNLFRTGPGECKIEDTAKGTHYVSHWFDGLAHTHRFEIVADRTAESQVRVFYSSRRQSEERAKYIRQHGSAKSLISFAQHQDPCVGLWGKFMSTFKGAVLSPSVDRSLQNANVVVQANVPGAGVACPAKRASPERPDTPMSGGHRNLPDNLWVTTDANILRRVDPSTLEPVGVATQECFHPDLGGPLSCAHAERDPATGDYFNFNLQVGPNPVYRVFRVSAQTGATDILATIRCAHGARKSNIKAGSADITSDVKPAYIHSFFLTAHYAILCIPCTHIAQYGLKVLWTQSVVGGLEPFDERNKTRWVVVDRRPNRGGVVAEFESATRFFFHSVNAFEGPDGSIVCDVIDYATADIIQMFYYDVLMNRSGAAVTFFQDPVRAANVNPCLSRYRLPLPVPSRDAPLTVLQASRVWSMPNPHGGEMPTINPAYATKPHRYVYTDINRGNSIVSDGLSKADTATRSALWWHAPKGHTPGEAIFIARPGGVEEDDGVLLCVVLDGLAGKSYLLCLDARTMQETGRAEVGFAIGLGFHGMHTTGS